MKRARVILSTINLSAQQITSNGVKMLDLMPDTEAESEVYKDLGPMNISSEKMIRHSSALLETTHDLCREFQRKMDNTKLSNQASYQRKRISLVSVWISWVIDVLSRHLFSPPPR